jgi:hypothetical protein
VGLIEFAQTRLVGHSPEITDPLLVLLAALALVALGRHDAAHRESLPVVPDRRAPGPAAPPAGRNRRATAWVKLEVALRPEQRERLGRLSRQRGESVSGAARRALAAFVEETQGSGEVGVPGPPDAADGGRADSVIETVNLPGDLFESLVALSHGAGTSVGALTRAIIDGFLDGQAGDEGRRGDT